ncbi:MAG: flavodoxin family protein [Candidatus Thorarchaeota archaeon]
MKAVVVYDTKFGNTKQVAEGIAKVLNADIINVSAIDPSKLREYDVFAFGCPVHAWNMSSGMKKALKILEGESFVGKKVGTFDTRIASRFAGNAAKKIQNKLKKLGFEIAMKPVHFIVTGREGPLAEGEMEKVEAFAALK